jgi:hypothetical protein
LEHSVFSLILKTITIVCFCAVPMGHAVILMARLWRLETAATSLSLFFARATFVLRMAVFDQPASEVRYQQRQAG